MKRRKNKGKKHNISMHQLDDDTRKQMEEAIEKERQAMMKEESDAQTERSKTLSLLPNEGSEQPDLPESKPASLSAPVAVVENHFATVQKKEETEDEDNLNDREPEIANI